MQIKYIQFIQLQQLQEFSKESNFGSKTFKFSFRTYFLVENYYNLYQNHKPQEA